MDQLARFVHITASRKADGSPVLYALDSVGRVWWLSSDEKEWRPVSDRRTATTEEPSRYAAQTRPEG